MATLPVTLLNGTTADADEVMDDFNEIYTDIDSTNVASANKTGTGKFVLQTSPTIASPVLSGTTTGTYTLAGTPTITSPTINTGTLASPTLSGTVTLSSSPTLSIGSGTFTISGTGTTNFSTVSTDAGATAATFSLYRNSSTPAVSDEIFDLRFDGKDSGGNQTTYASIKGVIDDPTNGSEDGYISVGTIRAGAFGEVFQVQGNRLLMSAGKEVDIPKIDPPVVINRINGNSPITCWTGVGASGVSTPLSVSSNYNVDSFSTANWDTTVNFDTDMDSTAYAPVATMDKTTGNYIAIIDGNATSSVTVYGFDAAGTDLTSAWAAYLVNGGPG